MYLLGSQILHDRERERGGGDIELCGSTNEKTKGTGRTQKKKQKKFG